jgi:hypothetical protein
VKEWPSIFSGHSVRQMLAGAKSQSRRLPGPRTWSVDGGPWPRGWKFDLAGARLDQGPSPAGNVGPYLHALRIGADTIHRLYPLVQVGHGLWVRETWKGVASGRAPGEVRYGTAYQADGAVRWKKGTTTVVYADPDDPRARASQPLHLERPNPWRSPIFMPRRAGRLAPLVTAMRVERLQQISEEDARAEGVVLHARTGPLVLAGRPWVTEFRIGWDELHAEHPGAAWKDDPPVLALTFLVSEVPTRG